MGSDGCNTAHALKRSARQAGPNLTRRMVLGSFFGAGAEQSVRNAHCAVTAATPANLILASGKVTLSKIHAVLT